MCFVVGGISHAWRRMANLPVSPYTCLIVHTLVPHPVLLYVLLLLLVLLSHTYRIPGIIYSIVSAATHCVADCCIGLNLSPSFARSRTNCFCPRVHIFGGSVYTWPVRYTYKKATWWYIRTHDKIYDAQQQYVGYS